MLAIVGAGLAVALAACQPSAQATEPPGAPSTDLAQSQVESTGAPAVPPAAEPDAAAPGAAVTNTLPVTPTKPPPPPPPPPLPPPVPASAALQPAASSLLSTLNAFRGAVRERDMGAMLKLQRELVATADQAAEALKNDKSPEAESVRLAIADVRKGAAGDNNALDHAQANLQDIVGGQAASGGFGFTANTAPVDTARLMSSLNDGFNSFQQALRDRNAENALRLQGDLLSNISQLEQAARQDNSEKGAATRAAISALRKGLDGDPESLAAASSALARLVAPANTPPVQANPEVQRMASALRSKLDDFRTAAAGNSRTDLLRIQQQMLAEVERDSAALASDPSAPAKALKDAMAGVIAGVSGDSAGLEGARSALSKIIGDEQPQGNAAAAQQPAVDLPLLAGALRDKTLAFQAALQKNETGSMLKLQRDLLDGTEQADAALKNSSSKSAEELRAAIASLRTAFAGDLNKLDEALAHLNASTGAGAAPATPAPEPPAGKSINPAASSDALRPLAAELRNKMNSLRDVMLRPNQSPKELAKQQAGVRADVGKVNDALQGATGPKADLLRTAATAAAEAAGGDHAKVDAARKLLDEFLK